MLKIRYDLKTRLLTDWTAIETEFDDLEAREGEAVALLDIPKPDADDYEYLVYKRNKLEPSGKISPIPREARDLAAEIDELKARVKQLESKSESQIH